MTARLPAIKFKEYVQLDGTRKLLVKQVGDGSIITRFDKTDLPRKKSDVVCPHFLELKWAYGCPFNCAWCFLKGTLRMLDTKTKPVVKDYCKVQKHIQSLFENDGHSKEMLNTGELADSLMTESARKPFSRFIIPLFEEQDSYKVLFLTKSTDVRNLAKIKDHEQTIVSFSLNASSVSERWERAPHVRERIKAAGELAALGYEVRVRIDPIVPIEGWQSEYCTLIDSIFREFVPSRITMGSLRGLQSTINNAQDKSWVSFLSEKSNWGKKIAFKIRYKMYATLVEYLKSKCSYHNIALCKETIGMWNQLDLDYRRIQCNCML